MGKSVNDKMKELVKVLVVGTRPDRKSRYKFGVHVKGRKPGIEA